MVEKKLDKKKCKLNFVIDKSNFSEFDDIRVLGDFNGWNYEKGVTLVFSKNKFKGSTTVKSGATYEFRYILNGRHWFNDPEADGLTDSPYYGISNTLIIVPEGTEDVKPKATKKAEPKTTKVAAPKVAKAPAAKKVAAPKVVKTPVEKKVVAPKVTKAPVAKKVVAPKAAEVPAVKKVAVPKVAKTPVAKKVTAPKVAKVPAVKKVVAPKVAKVTKDDLKLIEGVGPKIATLLNAAGIITFADVAKANLETLQGVLTAAGARYALANPSTWAQQAELAAAGKMAELKVLQDNLDGGIKK